MAKTLDTFTITPAADGYLLQIEDEDGIVTELTATFDQLDLIAEEIDRQLNDDEEEELTAEPDEEPKED